MKLPPALPDTAPSADGSFKLWLGWLATVILALGFAVVMVYPKALTTLTPISKLASLAPPSHAVAAQEAMADAALPADFHRRALNALLVPLMDDDEPPRWTDTWMNFECGPATTVTVDGKPFIARKRIPPVAFTVRWDMDGCTPLGQESMELFGSVDLLVFHEDDGLSAIVMPTRLKVASHLGETQLHGSFTAQMSLDKSATTRP